MIKKIVLYVTLVIFSFPSFSTESVVIKNQNQPTSYSNNNDRKRDLLILGAVVGVAYLSYTWDAKPEEKLKFVVEIKKNEPTK